MRTKVVVKAVQKTSVLRYAYARRNLGEVEKLSMLSVVGGDVVLFCIWLLLFGYRKYRK